VFRVLILTVMAAVVVACEAPPPVVRGVVVPPDAVWEIVGGDLGVVVGLIDAAAGAGLLPIPPGRLSQSGLEAAGIAPPLAIAGRDSGGTVLTAGLVDGVRLEKVLASVLPDAGFRRRRLLGQVDALVDLSGATQALVRAGNGTVVVVLSPEDALAEAALAEALATGAVEAPRREARGLAWRLLSVGPLTGVVDDAIEGEILLRGRELVARARAPLSDTPGALALTSALSSPPTPMACVADDLAVLTLHLPAVASLGDVVDGEEAAVIAGIPGGLDAFEGRLTVAVLPPPSGTASLPDDPATLASLAVIGRPRAGGAAELRVSVDQALTGGAIEERIVGGRVVRSVGMASAPWRRLSVLTADDIFALGIGAGVVVDRVAAGGVMCPPGGRLIEADGPGLVALIERAAPELRVVRRLAAWSGADDPVALLAAFERFSLDATPAASGRAVDLQLAMTFARSGK
jgi:hypothetical protein